MSAEVVSDRKVRGERLSERRACSADAVRFGEGVVCLRTSDSVSTSVPNGAGRGTWSDVAPIRTPFSVPMCDALAARSGRNWSELINNLPITSATIMLHLERGGLSGRWHAYDRQIFVSCIEP